jgi:hypothetical protein
MDKYPARPRKIVHQLEHVILIQHVLRSAVIGDEIVAANMFRRRTIEIEIKRQGASTSVKIDAVVGQPEGFIQQTRGQLIRDRRQL